MLAFLTVALLIYGTMHIYALSKVWSAFPHSVALGLALALGGLVMTFSPLILWQMAKQNWHHTTVIASWVIYTWMGFLFLFCCIALALDLGGAAAGLLGFKEHLSEAKELRVAVFLAFLLMGYGFFERNQVAVEQITISTPKLPPGIGKVTIAQISDLHLGLMLGDAFLDRVIVKLREAQPDFIVATGDVLDGQGDNLDEMAARLRAAMAGKGAYAIIGNHEYFAGVDYSLGFLRAAGFRVLRGEYAATGGVVIAGVDDPSVGSLARDLSPDAKQALAAGQKNAFIILLKHQPVVDGTIPFDLQLSGHVHGGQIFPFGFMTRFIYGVATGLTQLPDGRWLYVSRGAGTWGPPIRLLSPPEITLIKIVSAPSPK